MPMPVVRQNRPVRRLGRPVVLASASPRRAELLKGLIATFEILPAHVDEAALVDPDPWVCAQRTAREKALVIYAQRPDALVISGDTVVALREGSGWLQLAKPESIADAERMLATLSGRTHTVVTGICLRWSGGMVAATEASQVTFRPLTTEEIAAYVATGEPMDKAGAYGLQGHARGFVDRIEGSTTNVIGLPMERLEEALKTVR